MDGFLFKCIYSIDLFISFVNFVNRDAQQGSIRVPANKSCEYLDNLRYYCSQGRSYRYVIGGGGGCQTIFRPLKRVITFGGPYNMLCSVQPDVMSVCDIITYKVFHC